MKNRLMIAMALTSTAMLAACGNDGSSDGGIVVVPTPTPTPTPAPAPAPTPAPTPAPAPTSTYSFVDVGPEANYTALAFLPDGRAVLGNADGTVQIGDIEGAPASAGKIPVFDGAGGILGIAVDPNFATTGLLFVSIAEGVGPTLTDVNVAVAKVAISDGKIASQSVIWRSSKTNVKPDQARFGGTIAIDPKDGEVLVAYGDLGDPNAAQDPASFKGKVLRMKQDGSKSKYNPTSTNNLDYVYAYGLRLPRSLYVAGDGTVYFIDLAPNKGNEIDVLRQGANYGWPLVSEGSNEAFVDYPRHATRSDIEPPVFTTNLNYSFAGVIQVRTATLGLKDEILLATFNDGIFRLGKDGRNLKETSERIRNGSFLSAIAERTDGRIYTISSAYNYKAAKLVRN